MNEQSSSQTGSNVVVSAIKVIAGLSFVAGIICFIAAMNSRHDGELLFIIGLACVMDCPLIWGFAYLVEAACKYLGKLEKKEEEQPRQTPAPKTAPAKRLSDDDRIANLKVLVETGALSQEEFEEEVNRIKSK